MIQTEKRKHMFTTVDIGSLLQEKKKGSKKQIQIAEALIEILSSQGLENITYGMIAKKCKMARSLIYHYFPTLTDLLIFTSSLIRHRYQSLVIEQMKKQRNPLELMRAYILSALAWHDHYPQHISVWFVFCHQCSVFENLAEHNKNLVDMGVMRIADLIRMGIKGDVFKVSQKDILPTARLIQLLITGAVASRSCEKRSQKIWRAEANSVLRCCLRLLGAE